MQQFLDDSMGV